MILFFKMLIFRRFFSRLSSMNSKPLTIVVALDDNNGIGRDNTIPWHIKNDLKFFRFITSSKTDANKQNAVIIGRKTYETFPKPLPNRLNIVVSSNSTLPNTNYPNVVLVNSFSDAIHRANESDIENIFIAGGVRIYEEAIETNSVQRMFITRVKGDFHCTSNWSSFNTKNFHRIQPIPSEYKEFFETSQENQTQPEYHLEIYEKDV